MSDILLDNNVPFNLMLGSSSIAMLSSGYLICEGEWLNRGFYNSSIDDLNIYISLWFHNRRPENILIYAAENDLATNLSVDSVMIKYQNLLQKIQYKFPHSNIHVIAIKKSPARKLYWSRFDLFNQKLKIFIEDYEVGVFHDLTDFEDKIAFQSDGVHLTNIGYRYFTKGINDTCLVQ